MAAAVSAVFFEWLYGSKKSNGTGRAQSAPRKNLTANKHIEDFKALIDKVEAPPSPTKSTVEELIAKEPVSDDTSIVITISNKDINFKRRLRRYDENISDEYEKNFFSTSYVDDQSNPKVTCNPSKTVPKLMFTCDRNPIRGTNSNYYFDLNIDYYKYTELGKLTTELNVELLMHGLMYLQTKQICISSFDLNSCLHPKIIMIHNTLKIPVFIDFLRYIKEPKYTMDHRICDIIALEIIIQNIIHRRPLTSTDNIDRNGRLGLFKNRAELVDRCIAHIKKCWATDTQIPVSNIQIKPIHAFQNVVQNVVQNVQVEKQRVKTSNQLWQRYMKLYTSAARQPFESLKTTVEKYKALPKEDMLKQLYQDCEDAGIGTEEMLCVMQCPIEPIKVPLLFRMSIRINGILKCYNVQTIYEFRAVRAEWKRTGYDLFTQSQKDHIETTYSSLHRDYANWVIDFFQTFDIPLYYHETLQFNHSNRIYLKTELRSKLRGFEDEEKVAIEVNGCGFTTADRYNARNRSPQGSLHIKRNAAGNVCRDIVNRLGDSIFSDSLTGFQYISNGDKEPTLVPFGVYTASKEKIHVEPGMRMNEGVGLQIA